MIFILCGTVIQPNCNSFLIPVMQEKGIKCTHDITFFRPLVSSCQITAKGLFSFEIEPKGTKL